MVPLNPCAVLRRDDADDDTASRDSGDNLSPRGSALAGLGFDASSTSLSGSRGKTRMQTPLSFLSLTNSTFTSPSSNRSASTNSDFLVTGGSVNSEDEDALEDAENTTSHPSAHKNGQTKTKRPISWSTRHRKRSLINSSIAAMQSSPVVAAGGAAASTAITAAATAPEGEPEAVSSPSSTNNSSNSASPSARQSAPALELGATRAKAENTNVDSSTDANAPRKSAEKGQYELHAPTSPTPNSINSSSNQQNVNLSSTTSSSPSPLYHLPAASLLGGIDEHFPNQGETSSPTTSGYKDVITSCALPSHEQQQQVTYTSPRQRHLPLVSEGRPLSSTQIPEIDVVAAHKFATSPLTNSTTFARSQSNHKIATAFPEGGIIQPAVQRPVPHPLPPLPTSRSSASSTEESQSSPTIIRAVSGHSVLRHPVPDINARSGSYTSNIANLEATAELFSLTSSIEDAIRDAHDELKRSDSRRSSILAASIRSGGDCSDGVQTSSSQVQPFVRQSSIVGLNSAARSGGYSPAGYIMSPSHSLSSRLRSSSKGGGPLSRASSTRSRSEQVDGEGFPVLSRTGAGKGSVRSVHSNRSAPLSLAEIAEMEPPSTLTHEAMEEVDHAALRGEDAEDDENEILARAYQHVEPDATDIEVDDTDRALFVEEEYAKTPVVEYSAESYWEDHEQPSLQLWNPEGGPPTARDSYHPREEQVPAPTPSPNTDNEANAFADFDGMHCDPDTVAEQFPFHPEEAEYQPPVQRRSRMMQPPPVRPQSYFDPETNQQMLFYPARVPAMLNLPPKLGKGGKNAQRNVRRSQVLDQMPQASRASRVWLPDPLENEDAATHFMGEDHPVGSQYSADKGKGKGPEKALANLEENEQAPLAGEQPMVPEPLQLRRPAKITGDKRKSRMALSELPPQLRASAFFDLPAEAPKIEIKNGSAIATLDSILDASASAPVHAFTDHAIAGHLGSEVYGLGGKKPPDQKSKLMVPEDATDSSTNTKALAVPVVKKRRSAWDVLRGKSKGDKDEDSRSRLSGSGNGDRDSSPEADERSALAPSAEEGSDAEEEKVYNGPPTTLLAELQLRKHQAKLRTQNVHQVYPDGIHSTLLELDAVHQIEAKARRNRKVALAWTADTDGPESEDDEDVPLGLLAVKKRMGPGATDRDIAIAAQDLNRPLGLMDKREQEDNEPLSRRRDRLQGKPVVASMYLQPAEGGTRMTLLPGDANRSRFLRPMNSSGSLRPITPLTGSANHSRAGSMTSQNAEVEGETLGQRKERLRAQEEGNLPTARPVSMAFTSELLSQFGDLDEDKEKLDKGKGKENDVPPTEEEETLGQRRRRLQAEREAREREMASGGGTRAVSGGSATGGAPLTRRTNLAGVLGANPLSSAMGQMDPREEKRIRTEIEGDLARRTQDAKMAAFRASVPTQLRDVSGGRAKSGGYMGGKFNDSTGGSGIGAGLGMGQGHGHAQSQSVGVRPSPSLGQLNPHQVYAGMLGQNTWADRSASNLIGAAGTYGNPNMGLHGQQNPMYVSSNAFGNGHNGGLLQQMPQQPSPFVNGSLLAMGGYGGGASAFGGGIGAAGGYATNQTAYGAGVGFANPNGYAFQPPTQAHLDQVERWRQSIQLNGARHV